MASWELVPCLVKLRDEINRIAPNRSKTSDGTIGDEAHQERTSDHNDDEVGKVPVKDADSKHEVHALDVDKDLNQPGLTMHDIVNHTLARCRRDNSDPENEARLTYIIWDGFIYQAPSWKKVKYTGDNQHKEHAHFSAEYVTALEADTSSWHLEDLVAITDDEIKRIWKFPLDVDVSQDGTNMQEAGSILRYCSSEHKRIETKVDTVDDKVDALKSQVSTLQTKVNTLETKLDQVLTILQGTPSR